MGREGSLRELVGNRRLLHTYALGFEGHQLAIHFYVHINTYSSSSTSILTSCYLSIILDFFEQRYWQSRLKDLVEQWSGVELELTDIYGMRRYEDGARLLAHVDREETHATSLIINVAQGEIRTPWKV